MLNAKMLSLHVNSSVHYQNIFIVNSKQLNLMNKKLNYLSQS